MKKFVILLVLLALTMGSITMAIAAENVSTVTGTAYSVYNVPPAPIVPPIKPVIKGRAVVQGVVYSVYGDTLTVQKFLGKKKLNKVTFTINAQTKIIWNKKALKAANVEIQKGSRVLVKGWILSNGKLTAVEIKVLKGKVLPKKKVVPKKIVVVKKIDDQATIKQETITTIQPVEKETTKSETKEKGKSNKGSSKRG